MALVAGCVRGQEPAERCSLVSTSRHLLLSSSALRVEFPLLAVWLPVRREDHVLRLLRLLRRLPPLTCAELCLPVKGSRPGKNVQLTEGEIRGLCLKSREIFLSQPILLELEAPLKICGESGAASGSQIRSAAGGMTREVSGRGDQDPSGPVGVCGRLSAF